MSNKVVITLKRPIFGAGVLTDRPVFHEKVFSEEVHGKNYKELAKEWSTTHANNVGHIEGLDDASEKAIDAARKKSKAE